MESKGKGAAVPHFVLIPLMAQGHMLPIFDVARLLASRRVLATVVSTPLNAARFRPAVDLAADAGLPLRLVEIPFPCREAGLPEGCENLDTLPSKELLPSFFRATAMMRPAAEAYISTVEPPASCIVSDMGLPWTTKTARILGIPRILFSAGCCFTPLCVLKLRKFMEINGDFSDGEPLPVPGIPHRIEVTAAQLPANFGPKSSMDDIVKTVREAEKETFGVVVNSFADLEHGYDELYREIMGMKVWTVGPVALGGTAASSGRGKPPSVDCDDERCRTWLDEKTPRSVIYVCFGSLARFSARQLAEIGLGLEASGHPFIWVIRAGGDEAEEVERWLGGGFEERTAGRGRVIRGWAPQVLILSHPAVGGFLTHCGWNSAMEGVAAGVPMVTWPMFADQFLNEKLVVDVARAGVSLGVKSPSGWMEERPAAAAAVGREGIREAVERVMDPGEEGEERRRRARELGEKAREAMEEGGSSYRNLTQLIHDVANYRE